MANKNLKNTIMKRIPRSSFLVPSSEPCASCEGFTLVELLVSIALFSILVSIAAGGFVNALRTERQAAAMMAAESNVSIAFEQMAREMRTGYLFCHDLSGNSTCPACSVIATDPDPTEQDTPLLSCPNFIEYYNADAEKVDYSLVNGVIERSVNGSPPQAITGDNVSIRYLTFTLFGTTEGDHWNPRVTMAVGVAPVDSTINWITASLETTVSAREIDCTQGASPAC